MTKENVIDFPRHPEDDYEPHWEALARQDPKWAARQIMGLLKRALQAERLAARVAELEAALDSVAAKHTPRCVLGFCKDCKARALLNKEPTP